MQNKLMYFYDRNCAHCYTETAVVDQFAQEWNKVIPICKINVDEHPEVAKKYLITSTPTVAVIKDGKKVDQFSRDLDLNQLKTVANYYFGGMKMEKQKEKPTKLQTLGNASSLDAGICGPDGCVIDWSKTEKDDK